MRGYACVGLFQPKDAFNIGGVLRAAYCYDVSMVAVQGKRYKHHPADTTKAFKHLPLFDTDNLFDLIPRDCVPVAVELDDKARDLRSYVHPERAFYIFGPEDGSLGHQVYDKCRDIVYIPTKMCLNLAACVNVVLYDRLAKQ